jgi:prepilin-type N-terminal cleavage/methylation domain-containing protein
MALPKKNGEGGFTLVEVLVAILILAIASMTTFSLLSAAARNGQRAKASQVALEYAEQELELLRSMEDDELALETPPQPSTNPLSPNYRVSGLGTFALTREPRGNYRTLVVKGEGLYGGGFVQGGTVSPGPTKFTSGDVSGKVYRYIVWHNDEKCPEASCPGKQDYKQIVVAVRLDTPPSQAAERGYVEVQSNFIDPTDNAESDPLPGPSHDVVTAQQFFLSDTPCASGGITAHPPEIGGDHVLHNTLGTCASGVQSGTTKGSPDALLLGSPPDPDPEDPTNPAAYDYSSDIAGSGTETGLQIRKDDTNGCHYVPTGTTIPASQVHRWVTDPMATSFVMTEKVTIEFYTRALINEFSAGKLCVYIYKRHETGTPPVATDTLLTNTVGATPYWTYTRPQSEPWPDEWTKVRLTMNFNGAPYTIPAGDRLGLALSVERSETPDDGLSFMYDHPLYPSRIEVDTSTPIDGG